MNLIDALANGDILKYDSVLYVEYNTIYIKMLMNKETTLYNRRLQNHLKREAESRQKRYR